MFVGRSGLQPITGIMTRMVSFWLFQILGLIEITTLLMMMTVAMIAARAAAVTVTAIVTVLRMTGAVQLFANVS